LILLLLLLLLRAALLQWGYASLADAVQAWYDEVRRATVTSLTWYSQHHAATAATYASRTAVMGDVYSAAQRNQYNPCQR
jgi:hypothetical protein